MKIGRNDPCVCGSGKKYKKCCLNRQGGNIEKEVSSQFARLQAQQNQREKQQGLGRPIISIEHNGHRFVAVGSHCYSSAKWKTFPDFLGEYIKIVFGKEWAEEELKKPLNERHPILQWYYKASKYMKEHQDGTKQIYSAPIIGAMSAYLNLSYNLYLIAHNFEDKIQGKLVQRLKNIEQFQGALYETYVVSIFILAGFKLEMEDESVSGITHCEFTAIAPESNNKYSVEAKARQPYKENSGIGRQLGNALKKEARFKRVIFIDVNIPRLLEKMPSIVDELTKKELNQQVNNKEASPAYVFITNHSYAYDLDSTAFERTGFAHGFKIDDFKIDAKYSSIRAALSAREKHKDMEVLIKSIREHDEIPATFDGEIPEFIFNNETKNNRLLIGNRYIIPDSTGQDTEAVLVNAIVVEQEKKIYGVYQLKNSKQVICTNPISEDELQAYKKHPDTFFGVPLKQGRKINDPLELFDFFYESYKNCPRERLLEFLKIRPNFEQLKSLDTQELIIECCEGWVYSALNK